MNRSLIPAYDAVGVRRRAKGRPPHAVYADLTELLKMEFKARGFSFLPRQPLHSVLAGRHASRLRGRGLNFEEIRRYLPGDDIRNMDWRVTARLQKPHVRVYTEERDRPCLLVVDQRLGMFFGTRRCMKSIVAAEAAAIAAWRAFHSGDRVGAIIFDDSDIIQITPHRSRQRIIQILQAIVVKNHALGVGTGRSANPGMLNTALTRALQMAKHDSLVCLIAGGGGADEQTVRLSTQLAAHNDVIVSFVYDPMEAELPPGSRLIFAQDDLQLEADGSNRRLQTEFSREFQQRLEWMRHITRQRQTPLIPLSTARGVAEQLRELLGHVPTGSIR
jgi:uncharacterized protein (DUF58 family)